MSERYDDETKKQVQKQFGRSSSAYATSEVHSQGESLDVLLEMTVAAADWKVLDVATGAGHTALMFAPLVEHVVATDITPQMLEKTRQLAAKRCLSNVTTQIADSEKLPFADGTFDLLTCRLALHHFPNPMLAVHEFFRVLKPGGKLGFTDNFTLDAPSLVDLYNQFERLRDPSHVHVPPIGELLGRFELAGFLDIQHRTLNKEFEFHSWADRQQVSETDKARLLSMMREFPSGLVDFFRTRWANDTMYFHLHEAVVVASKPVNSQIQR